jgi:hypothetical protein
MNTRWTWRWPCSRSKKQRRLLQAEPRVGQA